MFGNTQLWTKKELFIWVPILFAVGLGSSALLAGVLFTGSLLYVISLLPVVYFVWKYEQEEDWSGMTITLSAWVLFTWAYMAYAAPYIAAAAQIN